LRFERATIASLIKVIHHRYHTGEGGGTLAHEVIRASLCGLAAEVAPHMQGPITTILLVP